MRGSLPSTQFTRPARTPRDAGILLVQMPADGANVGDEQLFGERPLIRRRAKHGGWMDGSEDRRSPPRFERDPALLHYAEGSSEKCLRRGGAKADDHSRLDECNLVFEPRHARADLASARRLVDAPLGASVLGPLEVLDGVRDVHVIAVDACRVEGMVEEPPRRPDERPSGLVLRVTRLLPDRHDLCGGRTFAEHGLGAELVQIAAATPL